MLLRSTAPPSRADLAGVTHEIFWRDTEPVEPGPPLTETIECDVAIVGGGYTGLWTAFHLKQAKPELRVQIVEADYAGAGASGHNDGFVTPTIGHSLHTVVKQFGIEKARPAYAAVGRSIMELRRFTRKHGVDAELEPNGFFLVGTNSGQMRRLNGDVALAAEMGVKYDVLDAAQAQEFIGSKAIQGALKTPGAVVNPHRLARGLARVVRDLGVGVWENTPALDLDRQGDRRVVVTRRGRLVADRVLLATNAYQHRWNSFKHTVKPVWSYALVSEPLTDAQMRRVHWPGREGFVEARNYITFGRFTAENRLLLGGGPAPYFYNREMDERHVRNLTVHDALAGDIGRWFPQWRDLRWDYSYGGCIAVTRDLIPHVGEVEPGVFYAYGYCGNGIAMTHAASKSLRDLLLGRDTDYTKLLYVNGDRPRFPPEPVSYFGARAATGVLAFQDRHPGLLRKQIV